MVVALDSKAGFLVETAGSGPVPQDEQSLAFRKILRWVKVRDRSIYETRARLIREGLQQDAVEKAIRRAQEHRFLDDERFADTLVRSRLSQGKGLDGIVRELRSHGIDAEAALPGFPEEYLIDRPSQRDCAYSLLCKKPPRAKNARQAAYGKLIRAGYPMALSVEIANKWVNAFTENDQDLSCSQYS